MQIERELLAIGEEAVAAALEAGAQEAEACLSADMERKVVFQRGDLGSVSSNEERTLGLRVIVDGRQGFVTSNRPGQLGRLAAEAVAIARASPADALAGLPEPQPEPPMEALVDEALDALGPDALARLGVELQAFLDGFRDPRCPDARIAVDSMELGVQQTARAVLSSRGVRQAHRAAFATGSVFGMAVQDGQPFSFSYDGDAVRGADELGPALHRAFERFGWKCTGAVGAGPGESFRGPMILPADVLADVLIDPLLANLGADAVRQGTSPLGGRLGERIAVPGFHLVECGPGLPGLPLSPFDREGMPRQRRVLVEDGVLRGFLYDGYEARHAGVQSSGHAQGGAAALPRVGAATVEVGAGAVPLARLEELPRAIVVTRFSGTVEPSSGDFTGVVKGGFLVERGERRPVMETTIAGNLWAALRAISGISEERLTFYGTRRFPAVRIEDISVSAG